MSFFLNLIKMCLLYKLLCSHKMTDITEVMMFEILYILLVYSTSEVGCPDFVDNTVGVGFMPSCFSSPEPKAHR